VRGFTDKVIEVLQTSVRVYRSGDVYRATVGSKTLIDISKLLPPQNLDDSQNGSPKLKDFLELAEMEGRCLFEIYIVPKTREDERVTVEGVLVPRDRKDLVVYVLERAEDLPSEIEYVPGYVRMWWD
jgi:hypothetical protein